MYRIKLLTLLLLSLILFSCINKVDENYNQKFSIDYIGGEYDGLIFSNLMKYYLESYNLFNPKSDYKISATLNHSTNVYITNIDNTSDRERLESSINLKIYDSNLNCDMYEFKEDISQFYIFAPGEKFTSNERALEEIKFNNSETIIKRFVNEIVNRKLNCE